ncbi:UDP-3-O-[3-hydroxymyristoyl] N-acetylglucosamine deacetylase/3-hydroxyacyl-[acyl-carrier-protein] dehydratase [Dysgonomonas sp. PH5-45]|uniref:bifunctional UDP-3-O-[3-hydroxymyristoyl] N-acetylglucosamine deacetylase/3-hydroxyacyl-ACP dehydratase n=1 Tax=unclassified Dysgonomonas TaxID=2630389 RepID=UPI002474DCA7|nr:MULTISPECIES: bifunctional UDP-3-O-[3-hydroxymyristoyl] N-acetylglucosamine deacetylase/3-hydroxyacyl-ACP dehydratase [unclassified Dysgonomonas]MDH6353758.1 UDP-3-O-[3-hydroxymyristoyl] N-acetylglucosamine deacetylase/3-hydroxyacyl-[acyl-carrier-protein] dehydratase [Dysgonomonas sp. PH5-45]MDH6386661.1 UDP-3-O-[3-hydroxymyristoyl] N-acetylglucosamine deacetylase/3-hydroxyacyl-[acyl-carrier-protein] dehydratase [Dysgonomonas sp. PH5-37]
MEKQKTIKESFTLEGKGLHTGLFLKVTFNPAPENHGYKIRRTDLEGQPIIDALAENVGATQRGTVLIKNDIQISTVEHAMAALYALEVDNCLIDVDGPEFPILDGSSIKYVEEINRVGLEEQSADRDYFVVRRKIQVMDEETGSKLILLPDDHFCVNSFIEFESKYIPNQSASLDNIQDFEKEIASCRTFVFVREIQKLLEAGLIKGGDLDNAIVIYEKQIDQESLNKLADLLGVPHKDASELGYLNNKSILFPNEPARHKLLDIIGDMALIGKPIKGRVIATRPGHNINNKLARVIRKQIKQNDVQPPIYDVNEPAVFDINQIRNMLPHRYPFLMVDKIIEIGQKHIVGVKNITTNEPFFEGHFPQEPVMPGVLQVEAMAQVGGILVLSGLEEADRYSTYFLKIDNVKFRQKVVPGDTLIFRLDLLTEIRRGIANMKGYAFVGEKVVSEAEFTAQIIKNK